jgi:hypothetical protein
VKREMSDENDGDGYGINDNDATTSCIICHTVRRRRKDIGNLDSIPYQHSA